MENCSYDIILLQEIHFGLGRSSSQWDTPQWHIVTSVDPDTRFAGVAVCIRKGLASADQTNVNEVRLGRLLHVRVYPAGQGQDSGVSLDVTCVYQHEWGCKASSLDTSLQTFGCPARRNLLLLGGDFNCTPTGTAGLTGGGLIFSTSAHADSSDFRDILVEHDLCAINTWTSRRKRATHTFQHGDRLSQIDFLFLRRHASDHVSREGGPLHGAEGIDHSPWRGGSKHAAVSGSIPFFPGWRAGNHRRSRALGYDKAALDRAVRQNSSEVTTLQHMVSEKLARLANFTADNLNEVLLESCKAVFPTTPGSPSTRPWQQEHIQASVRSLWQARSTLMRLSSSVRTAFGGVTSGQLANATRRSPTDQALLSSVFAFLKGHHALQKIYKQLHHRGKQARKQKLIDKLELAKAAADRHDQMQLYKVVRSLAPKTTRKPARIKNSEGAPLSPKEEHGEIMQYFGALYKNDSCPLAPLPEASPLAGTHGPLAVTEDEMRLALKQNAIGKSVPHDHAPSGAWAACSGQLLGPLCTIANDCLSGSGAVGQTAILL